MIQCSKCGENFATSSATTADGQPVCLACVLVIRPDLRGMMPFAPTPGVPDAPYVDPRTGAVVQPAVVVATPAAPHPVSGGRQAAIARGVDEWERWLLDAGQPAMRVVALRSYRREVVGLLLDALAGMGAITWTGEATR